MCMYIVNGKLEPGNPQTEVQQLQGSKHSLRHMHARMHAMFAEILCTYIRLYIHAYEESGKPWPRGGEECWKMMMMMMILYPIR